VAAPGKQAANTISAYGAAHQGARQFAEMTVNTTIVKNGRMSSGSPVTVCL
jgi:hypothetical protein